MKYIVVPNDVTIVAENGQRVKQKEEDGSVAVMPPIKFRTWLGRNILNDPQLAKTATDLLTNTELAQKIKDDSKPYIELSQAEYDYLDKAIETPTGGYDNSGGFSRQLAPFLLAFKDAKNKKPPAERSGGKKKGKGKRGTSTNSATGLVN